MLMTLHGVNPGSTLTSLGPVLTTGPIRRLVIFSLVEFGTIYYHISCAVDGYNQDP